MLLREKECKTFKLLRKNPIKGMSRLRLDVIKSITAEASLKTGAHLKWFKISLLRLEQSFLSLCKS